MPLGHFLLKYCALVKPLNHTGAASFCEPGSQILRFFSERPGDAGRHQVNDFPGKLRRFLDQTGTEELVFQTGKILL